MLSGTLNWWFGLVGFDALVPVEGKRETTELQTTNEGKLILVFSIRNLGVGVQPARA